MNRFSHALAQPGVNIIAEIKYSSPSHGPFACQSPPAEIGRIYIENGAAAISVLTEKERFAGDLEYLRTVSQLPDCPPLLRKDFIKTAEQVKQACEAGASAYLLIVADLKPAQLHDLLAAGEEAGIEALVEIHEPCELDTVVREGARLVGVNNRNLRTFEVNVDVAFDMARRLEGEKGYVLVAESGIKDRSLILELRDAGYSAFLIGGALMDSSDPGRKLRELRGAI
jgi:indole-3-glycerol phosphate synthase